MSGANGLTVTADNVTISHMVIDGFQDDGIRGDGANLTLLGNFIGTNAAGTAAAGNAGNGIEITGTGAHIGGTNGTTPGGSCTGDCNLISGNIGFHGIVVDASASGALIESNFIGTDVTGTAALGNVADGVALDAANAVIGGTTASARNVISGNEEGGIFIGGSAPSPTVEGNFIGTNSAGTAAVPSGFGVYFDIVHGGLLGGTAPGAGNVISGSTTGIAIGVRIEDSRNITVQGNLVGTAVDGTTPLPNSVGIRADYFAVNDLIGGQLTGAANTIAFNTTGVLVDGSMGAPVNGIAIRGNSIHSNSSKGISNVSGGNNELAPPMINSASASGAGGTACASCQVDVYSDDAGQGRTYEGLTTAGAGGAWTFTGSISGPNVTATANDQAGDTSEFSAPFTVPVATPSPTPTHSPTPTPTRTPTPTPTATSHPSPTVPPCGSPQYRGDADGNGHVDINDVLATLSVIAHVPPGAACAALAEVDCDNELAADDALRILDYVAGAPLAQPTGCPGVGTLT